MSRATLIILLLATLARTAACAEFDYHSVRGRKAKQSSTGRHEGERDLEMRGASRAQDLRHYGQQWSGGAHLLWDGVVGESMTSSFEVDAAGEYDIVLQLTGAPDYGLFDMSLNGRVVKKAVDAYHPRVDLLPPIKLSNIPLKAGRQALAFKLVGANLKAHKFRQKGYLLGLDYLQLKRKAVPNADPKADIARNNEAQSLHNSAMASPLDEKQLAGAFQRFCLECHAGDEAEGDLNLQRFASTTNLSKHIAVTQRIRNAVSRQQMPPPDAKQPAKELRRRLVASLQAVIDSHLRKNTAQPPIVMRRLNRYEYNNAVRDLLQLKGDIYPLPEKTIRAGSRYFDPSTGRLPTTINVGNRTLGKNQVERQVLKGVSPFAIDLQAEGGFNNRGRELSVSPILLESFLRLGQSIVNSPQFDGYCQLSGSLFSPPSDSNREQQERVARKRLASLLERAFRRRVDAAVLDRYHAFFVRQLRQGRPFSECMKTVVAAVLASPKFIYIASSPPAANATANARADATADSAADASAHASAHEETSGQLPLNSYDLATRLSFFLWSSIPDEELLAAARDGSLSKPSVLDAQVKRMLEHPRSQALSQNFARQWLRLDQLVTAVPDFERFPQYYSRIGCEQWKFGLQTMLEPLLLFESVMVEDRSIMLLIDSNYSYRSDEMQSWYETDQPFGGRDNINRFNTFQQAYRRRALKDRRQGGVITTAATMTMTSSPLRTSPIVRGAWVATVIFNQPPPPPPDTVPEIEADDKEIEAKGLTLRQRLVQHQENRSCASCHQKIDPLGFALENYDAIGRWRDKYRSGLAIDASGKLFGEASFRDAVGLKDAIRKHPEWFFKAFSEHMLSYALGRELELADAPAVDKITDRVLADHGQFTTVVRAIVQSRPFRFYTPQEPMAD